MFTVKWIASNGAEMIYNARDVSYTPPGQLIPANAPNQDLTRASLCDPKRAIVSFYITGQQSNIDGDSHCTIDNGRVYVMNQAGRTVADYVLETEEFPHGLAPRQAA